MSKVANRYMTRALRQTQFCSLHRVPKQVGLEVPVGPVGGGRKEGRKKAVGRIAERSGVERWCGALDIPAINRLDTRPHIIKLNFARISLSRCTEDEPSFNMLSIMANGGVNEEKLFHEVSNKEHG